MQSRTIFTVDHAKLDKAELDILYFIESWLPTFSYWDVREFGWKLRMEADDVTAAVDMLILHGLLDVQPDNDHGDRIVSVPAIAATWMRENSETIYSLHMMNDSELFTSDETATA